MGVFDDMLIGGAGLAFAQHEHNKHQMQRQVLQHQLDTSGPQGGYQQQGYQQGSRGMQQGGYGYNQGYDQGYGQDMITVSRSEWNRLQQDAADGRQAMQKYTQMVEELERERRQMRQGQ